MIKNILKMSKKQKIVAGAVVGCLVVGVIAFGVSRRGKETNGEQIVYVNSIDSLINAGNTTINRFAGVVEAQEKKQIQANPEKTVETVYVSEGDQVSTGTPLFSYSTETDEENLSKAQLELEKIQNTIQNKNSEIEVLEKEKKSVSSEEQLDYTMQIQSAKMELKQSEYELKSKETEIKRLQESIESAEVKSEMEGVVKSIQSNSGEMQMNGQDSQAFMTIVSMGNFRIKGKVNEQNIGAVMSGQKVLVHSRVDEKTTWTGVMGEVDRQTPETSQNNFYSSDSMTQSNSYPFYVQLDSCEGLMLGQHVYIETDLGQENETDGIWLDEYFIAGMEENAPYVWADNGKGKLEQRKVKLGEYDEALMKYEIVEGLSKEDLITFPEEGLKKGMKTVKGEFGEMGQAMQSEEDSMMQPEGEDMMPSDETEMPGTAKEVPEGENGGEVTP